MGSLGLNELAFFYKASPKDTHSLPVRARNEVSFVNPNSDIFPFIIVCHIICNIISVIHVKINHVIRRFYCIVHSIDSHYIPLFTNFTSTFSLLIYFYETFASSQNICQLNEFVFTNIV